MDTTKFYTVIRTFWAQRRIADYFLIRKTVFVLIGLSLLLGSCAQPPRPAVPTDVEVSLTFKETIGVISRHRTEAENAVLKVKRDSEGLSSEQIAMAFDLYNSARVEFNAWIDEVKAGLTQEDFELTAPESEHLEIAIQKKEQLVDYVSNNYSLSREAQSFIKVLPIVGQAVDAVIKVWEEFNRVDEARRLLMIQALDEQRWRSWNDVQ